MEKGLPERQPGQERRVTVQDISDELVAMEAGPPNNDPYIAAFAGAANYLLVSSPEDRLRLSVEDMLESRRTKDSDASGGKKEEPFTPLYAANLLLRSVQHTALFRRTYPVIFRNAGDLPVYPSQFNHPGVWVEEINQILNDPMARDTLDFDLTYRRIQSNIADRYKGIKLAILLKYPDRFNGPVAILDVGASLNLGLTKLMINRRFGEVEVLSSDAAAGPDPRATRVVNQLINSPFEVGAGVGVDSLPVYDSSTSEWVRSCSFYPGELLNPNLTEEFDQLILASALLDEEIANRSEFNRHPELVNLNLPKLSHYEGDFSNRNSMRGLAQKTGTDKFHIVSFITIMHQLSNRQRSAMIDRAKQHLLPGGLIVIQDFLNVNAKAPNGLEFPPRWTKFMYKTVVIDPSAAAGPKEIITWDYGRCRQAVLPT